MSSLLEKYATAFEGQGRKKVLADLVPGSTDYFVYSILDHLNVGRVDPALELLKEWSSAKYMLFVLCVSSLLFFIVSFCLVRTFLC